MYNIITHSNKTECIAHNKQFSATNHCDLLSYDPLRNLSTTREQQKRRRPPPPPPDTRQRQQICLAQGRSKEGRGSPLEQAMARSYAEELARLQIALEEESAKRHIEWMPVLVLMLDRCGCCVSVLESVDVSQSGFACSAVERDEMVAWLHLLTDELSFCHEVFFRAVVLLDTFLSSVKIKQSHIRCVTGTCFFIAAKLEEVVQPVGNLLEVLVDQYGCECTRRDIQRMELIVMHKLEFHLNRPTPQDFLKSFHSLSLSSGLVSLPYPLTVEKHLQHLAHCLELVVCNSSLMQHRPCMLALAVLGCDLKVLNCDWLSTLLSLQTLARVRAGELSLCYEAVAAVYPTIIARYPLNLPPPKPPRKEVVVTLLPQGVEMKVKRKEEEEEEEEKEEEESKIQREETDSMQLSLYNTQ